MKNKILSFLISIVLSFSFFALGVSGNNEEILTAKELSVNLEDFLEQAQEYESVAIKPEGTDISNEDIISNRLIVGTITNQSIENDCGAILKLEGYENWHFLQYENTADANSALNYYLEQDYVEFAVYDEIIDTIDPIEKSIESNAFKITGWGTRKIESAEAIKILNDAQIPLYDITVAVIDTGVEADHPIFRDSSGNSRVIEGNRPKDNEPDSNMEAYDHGTHVAGIIIYQGTVL